MNTTTTPNAAGTPPRPKYKRRSMLQETWRRFRKNRGAVIGLCMLLAICLLAIGASIFIDYDTQVIGANFDQVKIAPCWEHPFGTDEMGRDILIRVIYGARYSLSIGIVAVGISIVIGVALGALAGYVGGILENIIMRITDIFIAVPNILLAIAIVSALGQSTLNLMVAIGICSAASFVQIARAAVLTVRNNEYVEAARAIGASNWHIIISHILPNSLAPIIVQATLRVGASIISASSLSFLGIGIPLPAPEWGAMLSSGRNYIRDYSYMTLFPGLAIMLTVVSLNLVGDALRDSIDPKLKK